MFFYIRNLTQDLVPKVLNFWPHLSSKSFLKVSQFGPLNCCETAYTECHYSKLCLITNKMHQHDLKSKAVSYLHCFSAALY